jgi:hypothetical protein
VVEASDSSMEMWINVTPSIKKNAEI